jgi:hypothetical protein
MGDFDRGALQCEQLRQRAGGGHLVCDPVGGSLTEPAVRSLAWRGRLLVIGFTVGEIPRVPLNLPLLKGAAIVGVFWGDLIKREPDKAQQNRANSRPCSGPPRSRPSCPCGVARRGGVGSASLACRRILIFAVRHRTSDHLASGCPDPGSGGKAGRSRHAADHRAHERSARCTGSGAKFFRRLRRAGVIVALGRPCHRVAYRRADCCTGGDAERATNDTRCCAGHCTGRGASCSDKFRWFGGIDAPAMNPAQDLACPDHAHSRSESRARGA